MGDQVDSGPPIVDPATLTAAEINNAIAYHCRRMGEGTMDDNGQPADNGYNTGREIAHYQADPTNFVFYKDSNVVRGYHKDGPILK